MAAALSSVAVASGSVESAERADPARLAARALLLDLTRAGDRLVAVGAHGTIVTSDDDGRTWQQAEVPARGMLNAVSFANETEGWAVGHGGLILRSSDGGRSWEAVDNPADEEASFLDVLALAPGHVLTVGAYGLFRETTDAGATWKQREPIEEDMHINRISRGRSGALLLAGESGMLAISGDDGGEWRQLDSPYEGSFYGLFELASGRLLAHGLRGNVFASDDRGESWNQIPLEHEVLIMGAAEAPSGAVVLAGLGGWIFVSTDGGATFEALDTGVLKACAEVLVARDGAFIVAGDGGIHRVPPPAGSRE